MWRWSLKINRTMKLLCVFSTYVEMILADTKLLKLELGVLHVCGDDPNIQLFLINQYRCSPRMWRWSSIFFTVIFNFCVFSTYVEMILTFDGISKKNGSVLHVCGDDPNNSMDLISKSGCSPRMWRWSHNLGTGATRIAVFSTYVEMILHFKLKLLAAWRVLHVCGDDPSWAGCDLTFF